MRVLRSWCLAASVLFALTLASCARAPREPAGSAEQLSARFSQARTRREQALAALRADVVLRVDGRATGRLPAIAASVSLAAPARMRVQARALLGIALDALVRGDSLFVRVPAERTVFVVDGAQESLGVGQPAEFAGRALAATWQPPAAAWREAFADSQGWRLGWREGGDSLSLLVDAQGLPVRARLSRGEHAVRIEYREWSQVRGRLWPVVLEIADESGWMRARIKVEDLLISKRADPAWFQMRMPPGVQMLSWDGVRDLFRREGGLR